MKKNTYLALIISCWVLLALALIIKLFGVNLFNILVKNQAVIDIGKWFDSSWTRYIVFSLVYSPATYLIYLAMTKKRIGKDWWFLIICLPVPFIKDKIAWLGWILDCLLLILIPLLRCKFKNWLRVIIGIVIVVSYQLLILFIRNLGIYIESNNIIIGLVMEIDYYIMVALFYLYSVERRGKEMGVFGVFFFGEADKVLIKEIAKEHKVPVEVVEKHYKEMLEAIKNEVEE